MQQTSIDSSRSRVTNVVLEGNALFVQSDRSQIQAFDAETGRPLWPAAKQVGNPDLVGFPLAVNHSLVAAVNGSHLYVLNRLTGEILLDKSMEDIAGAGPTLGDQHVLVPLQSGKVVAYRLKPIVNPLKELGKTGSQGETKEEGVNGAYSGENLALSQESSTPQGLRSGSAVRVQAVMGRQTADDGYISWVTEDGYVFISVFDYGLNTFDLKHRVTIGAGSDASTTYMPPSKPAAEAAAKPAENEAENPADDAPAAKAKVARHDKEKSKVDTSSGTVYAVTRKGLIYAIAERTGVTLWQSVVNEPIVRPAAVIGSNVYVTTELGGLHCLDAATGARKWWSPGIRQFVAQSKDRLYAQDRLGQLVILDPQNGAFLGSMPVRGVNPLVVMNTQNDRLYVVARGGLVQCFHESGIAQPLVHAGAHAAPAEKSKTTKKTDAGGGRSKPAAKAGGERPTPKPKDINADPLERPEKPSRKRS